MSGFADTLEQHKEFRRDFNRVLRFSNGVSRAQDQNVVQQPDLESGPLRLYNGSEFNLFTVFMFAYVNSPMGSLLAAPMPQPNDLVWQDTLTFLNDLQGCEKSQIKEKIVNFVTKIINNTNNSKHLTPEQKDLILDKLFANPQDNRFLSKIMLIPAALAITILTCYLAIKTLRSYDKDNGTLDPQYIFAALGSLIACMYLWYKSCAKRVTFDDPIAEDAKSLIAWAHEVAEELLRLQIPCEPDTGPIAIARIAYINDTNLTPNERRIVALFNGLLSCLVDVEISHADSLLQDNLARRRLDKLIKFMHNNIAGNTTQIPESAVKMYLQIRSDPGNVSQILRKFLVDCQTSVHDSTQITDLQKNELFDLIITNRQSTTMDWYRFQEWLLEMDQLCNRLTTTLDPRVIHDGEAVSASAIPAASYRKGYERLTMGKG